jgi:CheY-like chemotaxis protein
MTILVVDDNPSNVEICHEILADEFEVVAACNGQDAVRMAGQYAPDVVLLDIVLPDIDGYETCRRLRRLPSMQKALIVFVSAKAMLSERNNGLEAGADAYITKPFSDAEILKIVRSAKTAGLEERIMRVQPR